MNEEGDADILIISGSLEDDNGWAEASVGTQLLVADHQIASLTSSPSEKRRRTSPHPPRAGDVEMLGHAMMRESGGCGDAWTSHDEGEMSAIDSYQAEDESMNEAENGIEEESHQVSEVDEDSADEEEADKMKVSERAAFWDKEAKRNLRDASELCVEELAETVSAVELLTADQSGVQCLVHHPHGVRLFQALVLALKGTSKRALSAAIDASVAVAAQEEPPRRGVEGGNGGGREGEGRRKEGTVSNNVGMIDFFQKMPVITSGLGDQISAPQFSTEACGEGEGDGVHKRCKGETTGEIGRDAHLEAAASASSAGAHSEHDQSASHPPPHAPDGPNAVLHRAHGTTNINALTSARDTSDAFADVTMLNPLASRGGKVETEVRLPGQPDARDFLNIFSIECDALPSVALLTDVCSSSAVLQQTDTHSSYDALPTVAARSDVRTSSAALQHTDAHSAAELLSDVHPDALRLRVVDCGSSAELLSDVHSDALRSVALLSDMRSCSAALPALHALQHTYTHSSTELLSDDPQSSLALLPDSHLASQLFSDMYSLSDVPPPDDPQMHDPQSESSLARSRESESAAGRETERESVRSELEREHSIERDTCFLAVNAICNISVCAAGRRWLAEYECECEALIQSLCALLHDQMPGWQVTNIAAASTLALSNLLCSKRVCAALITSEATSAAAWATDCAAQGGGTNKKNANTSTNTNTDTKKDAPPVFSVTCTDTGVTTQITTQARCAPRGAGTLVRGLCLQLSRFPSHAAVSSATAIGNLARRAGAIDLLLSSPAELLEMMEYLSDMVNDAFEDARAEALTALCNVLEDGRVLALLLRDCAQAVDDMVSGVAVCLAPFLVREALEQGDTEAVTDAAALIGRLLTDARGEALVMAHEQVPQIAAGLAALAHRSGDAEASQVAVEALCAMLDGVRSRPMLVSSMPAGALLFRLSSKVISTATQHVLDGLGRGEDNSVTLHTDSKRVLLAVTHLVHTGAARGAAKRAAVERAQQAARMSGAKFCCRPLLGGGGGEVDVDEEDEVAGKAAETLGRFAMQACGAQAVCAQGDVLALIRSLLLLASVSRASRCGCKLALYMLLSHEQVCDEVSARLLARPRRLAPPLHTHTPAHTSRDPADALLAADSRDAQLKKRKKTLNASDASEASDASDTSSPECREEDRADEWYAADSSAAHLKKRKKKLNTSDASEASDASSQEGRECDAAQVARAEVEAAQVMDEVICSIVNDLPARPPAPSPRAGAPLANTREEEEEGLEGGGRGGGGGAAAAGEEEEEEEEDRPHADDSVGAAAGMAGSGALVAKWLDSSSRLPVLVARLVVVLMAAEGEHADARKALQSLFDASPLSRKALRRITSFLTAHMLNGPHAATSASRAPATCNGSHQVATGAGRLAIGASEFVHAAAARYNSSRPDPSDEEAADDDATVADEAPAAAAVRDRAAMSALARELEVWGGFLTRPQATSALGFLVAAVPALAGAGEDDAGAAGRGGGGGGGGGGVAATVAATALRVLLTTRDAAERRAGGSRSGGGGGLEKEELELMAGAAEVVGVLLESGGVGLVWRLCVQTCSSVRKLVGELFVLVDGAGSYGGCCASSKSKVMRLLECLCVAQSVRCELARVCKNVDTRCTTASRFLRHELLAARRCRRTQREVLGVQGGAIGIHSDVSAGWQRGRRCVFEITSSQTSILACSVASVGAAAPQQLLRGGGLLVKLIDAPRAALGSIYLQQNCNRAATAALGASQAAAALPAQQHIGQQHAQQKQHVEEHLHYTQQQGGASHAACWPAQQHAGQHMQPQQQHTHVAQQQLVEQHLELRVSPPLPHAGVSNIPATELQQSCNSGSRRVASRRVSPPLPHAGVSIAEDDSDVLARWFRLTAQALPPAPPQDLGVVGPGAACGRGGCGCGGGHLASPTGCARFFGRLIAMALLWHECDGACLASSSWHQLWVGIHSMAQRDAALLEPTEGREEAGRCGGGVGGGGVEQAIGGCTDSEGPGGSGPTCAGRCFEQVQEVYAGVVDLLPPHLVVLLTAEELREAVLQGSDWKPHVFGSLDHLD